MGPPLSYGATVDAIVRVVQIPPMDLGQALQDRAEAGEASAQYELGRQLLSGPDAAAQLQRGLALIEAASSAGLAAATELRALFDAMGIARPPSWDRALDGLQLAAEQGSNSARSQLMLLADNARDAAIPAQPASGLWAKLRAEISLERLRGHGQLQVLSDGPRIRVIQQFATPAECRWLVERARSRLKPAMLFDPAGKHVLDPGRSNKGTDFPFVDMDLVLEMIRSRISAAINIPLPMFELTQILHYSVGQEFKAHHDFLDLNNPNHGEQLRLRGQRIATFLIYLNEDFLGGETEFPHAGIRYCGKTGDAIMFANVDLEGRPDPMTLHAGRPPTSGEKWILSQWIRDRAGQ